jgi:hypothetical protein
MNAAFSTRAARFRAPRATEPPAGSRVGRERPRLRRALLISAAVVGVLLVAGELTARAVVGNKVAHSVRSALGGHVTVGLGGQPAVVDALTQSIPTLSIHATQVNMCALKNVTVAATLSDVHRRGNALAVSGSYVQAVLDPQTLGAMLGKGTGGGAKVMVIPDTAQQLLQVRVGPGGLVSLYEKPDLVGNDMRFTPVGASIGGLAIPAGMVSQLTGNTGTAQLKLPRLPLGITPEAVQVTSGGVAVTASGPAAEARANGVGVGLGSTKC